MFVVSTCVAIRLVALWRPGNEIFQLKVFLSAAAFILIWITVFKLVGLYEQSFALSMKDEFYCTVAALCVGIVPQLVLFTIFPAIASSRLVLVVSMLVSIAIVGTTRAFAKAVQDAEMRKRPRRVTIVGQPGRVEAAIASLRFAPADWLQKIEVEDVDAALGQVSLTEDPELDNIPWFYAAKQWGSDTIILTEIVHPNILPHMLAVAERHRIKIAFAPPRLKQQAFRLSFEISDHQALIVPKALSACRPPARLLKRIFDIIVATAILLVFAPIIVTITVLLLFDRSGPVLYRQERIARGGRVFEILKFRTMPSEVENESGPMWAQPGDKRATKIGSLLRRTSLDELPQLLNVLRGEMSIVGPRPERPIFAELFREHLPRYDERHLVNPGITGWAQAQLRRSAALSDVGQKLTHDLYYIENWSVFMDISVILKTALEFLFHKAV